MPAIRRMAKRLEELPVFQKAKELWSAVHAILERSGLRKNRKLYDQIDDANDSITANMEEGFEQSSDEGFARYLSYSKGSVAEVAGRLRQAKSKGFITEAELREREAACEEVGRMLGGFIKYLQRSGFKRRGHYRSKDRSSKDQGSKDYGFKGLGIRD